MQGQCEPQHSNAHGGAILGRPVIKRLRRFCLAMTPGRATPVSNCGEAEQPVRIDCQDAVADGFIRHPLGQ